MLTLPFVQAEKVKETQWQLELILSEFGRAAMNTFTPLEIARGYAVAFPTCSTSSRSAATSVRARPSSSLQRLCKPTMASFTGAISSCSSLSPALLSCRSRQNGLKLCIASASMQSNRIVTLHNCMTRADTCFK